MGTQRKKPRGVAASVIVFAKKPKSFLMIQRKWEPDRGKWAFPGGYLEVDRETIEQAAVREVKEETGVQITQADLVLLDVLSDPGRDPRGHVIDIAFLVIFDEMRKPADSDETKTKWLTLEEASNLSFALGHDRLFKQARAYLNLS